jgi:hypothetical protein
MIIQHSVLYSWKLHRYRLKNQRRAMYLYCELNRVYTSIPCRFKRQCGNTRVVVIAIAKAYADNVGLPRPEKDFPLSV